MPPYEDPHRAFVETFNVKEGKFEDAVRVAEILDDETIDAAFEDETELQRPYRGLHPLAQYASVRPHQPC